MPLLMVSPYLLQHLACCFEFLGCFMPIPFPQLDGKALGWGPRPLLLFPSSLVFQSLYLAGLVGYLPPPTMYTHPVILLQHLLY